MKIPKIELLILDVDGTLTDGGIYIDENGKETIRSGTGVNDFIVQNKILQKQIAILCGTNFILSVSAEFRACRRLGGKAY